MIAVLVENEEAFKRLGRKLSRHKGLKILLARTGVGRGNVSDCLSRLLEKHGDIRLAVFLGSMGALGKGIKAGDIIIPLKFADISEPGEEYEASRELLGLCPHWGDKGLSLHLGGKNITVNRLYLGADKLGLKQKHPGFASLDMESASVARIFSRENIPFVIISAVSDEWDFSLPDTSLLFNAQYRTNIPRLFFYCLRYPQQILNLVALMWNARRALKNNLRFFERYLDRISQEAKYG